jgi:CBS domain containing-hemolysin-like protein
MLQRLLIHTTRPMTVILILITAINYTNESLVTNWLHFHHRLPEWVPFVALLLLVLIISEVTPINYAAANPEIVATRSALAIDVFSFLLHPLLVVFSGVANVFVRIIGVKPEPRPLVTGEGVRTIVDIETERGVLEEEEKELIHSIFEFSDTIVREIMVPRIDIIATNEQAAIGTVIESTITHRFSRLPVYRENLDHIVGLVHVKNLLPYEFRGETYLPVTAAMRPATFVPESKGVSELLQEFRTTKQTLAIVLDEYGGTAGLITSEDLLEEIVGEIYDEYDIEQKSVERIDTQTLIVDGKMPIDDLSDLLDYAVPEGEYDTVGGLLYSRFGDVPTYGEHIDIDGFDFSVERLEGHRITKVRVVSPEPRETDRREGSD